MSDETDDEEDYEPPEHYYANYARYFGTSFDLTLDFGFRLTESQPPEWLARVSMSWDEAQALYGLLGDALERVTPDPHNGDKRQKGDDEDEDEDPGPDDD